MANTINWGKIYEKTAWGIGVVSNTINWGKIYADLVSAIPSFALNFNTISDDFTFTRSSFATRVNEFGLIETVTDLGSELVQNGDFEELGSELVTNGDFATDSDWAKVNSTISNGKGNLDGDGQTSLLYQNILTQDKLYKVTFTVSDYNELGTAIIMNNDGTSYYTITTNGTFTVYFKHTIPNGYFLFRATNGAIYSIDNVSVKQVDPNDNWSFDNVGGLNGWRIADGRAICDTVNPLSGRNLVSTTVLTSGKTYKLTLDILQSVDGMTVLVGGTSLAVKLPIGTNLGYEYIIDSSLHTGGFFGLFGGSSDLQEIDNISIQEVLEDDVPRIDYTNSTFDDVLGSELIDYSELVYASGGWSLVDGKWVFDDVTTGQLEIQVFSAIVGEQYEVVVDVSIASGNANFRLTSGNGQTVLFDYTDFVDGVNKFQTTVTGVDGNILRLTAPTSLTDNPFTLNSISVKKVVGEIATDKGEFLLEPQSTNLVTYSENFTQWGIQENTLNLISGVAPDGNTSVYELTSVSSGKLQEVVSGLAINTTYTFSFYVKQTSPTTAVQSRILSQTGGSGGSNLTQVNYQDQLITGEWVRITHTFTTNDTLGNYIVYVSNSLTSGESLQFWGAQVEEGSHATSYIPTSGSTVTRSNETCVDATPTINSEEGTLYVEASALLTGQNRYVMISDGTTNNYLELLWFGTNDNLRVASKGTPAGFQTKTISNIGQENSNKIAFKYSSDGISIYVNGSEVGVLVSDSSFTPSTLTTLSFSRAGTLPFYGRTKDLRIYTEALSDSELEDLTTL